MTHLLAFLSTTELIFCLAAMLLLFGATKLPKLARSMGRSVGEFKAGLKDPPMEHNDTADKGEPTVDVKK